MKKNAIKKVRFCPLKHVNNFKATTTLNTVIPGDIFMVLAFKAAAISVLLCR
jgi:hypothetical protein